MMLFLSHAYYLVYKGEHLVSSFCEKVSLLDRPQDGQQKGIAQVRDATIASLYLDSKT